MDASMGMMGLGIVISLRDQISAGLDKIRDKIQGLKGVSADMVKQFDAGIKQIVGGFASVMAGSKIFSSINNTFGASIAVAGSFEQAMAGVKAVAGATQQQFADLTAAAKRMGRETQYTAMQAASAEETLIRAGMDVQQTLDALPATLNMAAAEGMGLAEAAGSISTTLNQFNLAADQASRIANLFAEASRSSALSISSLTAAMKYAGPVARAMGMSVEQTSAWLATLANNGFTGEQGGTLFRAIAPRLVDPKTLHKLRQMGVQTRDELGNTLGPEALMKAIGERMKGMKNDDVVNKMQDIFGKVAYGGAMALASNADALEGFMEKFGADTTYMGKAAEEMADTMNDTLEGAKKRFASAVEGLQISIGEILLPVMRSFIDIMTNIYTAINNFIEQHPLIAKAIIGGTTALAALVAGMLVFVGTMKVIRGTLTIWPMIRRAIGATLTGLKASIAGVSAPMIALIGLGATLYYAWKKNFGGIQTMFATLAEGWNMYQKSNKEGIFEYTEEEIERLQKEGIWDNALKMGGMFYRFGKFGEGFGSGFLKALQDIWAELQKIGDFFGGFFGENSFFGDILKKMGLLSDSSSESWEKFGDTMGYLLGVLIPLAAAFKGLAVAITIFNFASNPLFALLTTLLLIIHYWEDIKKAFSSTTIHPEAGNYDERRKFYEEKGFVFGDDGLIKDLPTSMYGIPMSQKILADANRSLKAARDNAPQFEATSALVSSSAPNIPISSNGTVQAATEQKSGVNVEEWKQAFLAGQNPSELVKQLHERPSAAKAMANVDELEKQVKANLTDVVIHNADGTTTNMTTALPMGRADLNSFLWKHASDKRAAEKLAQNADAQQTAATPPTVPEPVNEEVPPASRVITQGTVAKTEAVSAAGRPDAKTQAKIENKVSVEVKPSSVEVNIDGERVGESVVRWIGKQDMRSGSLSGF